MKVSFSKLTISFMSLLSLNVMAAPSLEGLFRNGDNPEIAIGSTVTTTYKLDLIHNDTSEASVAQDETAVALTNTIYVRSVYHIDDNGKVELFQVVSKNNDFGPADQIFLRYISRFDDYFKRDQQITRGIFQAVLSSLAINRSQEMSYVFAQYGKGFKYNKDIRNKDKIALYDSYKKYLALDKASQAQEESPLRPNDAEKKAEVQKVLKESFYDQTGNVHLDRVDGKFFWAFNLDTITGRFGSEDGRLKKIDANVRNEKLSIVADDYVSFDGAFQMPRKLTMNIDGQSLVATFITNRVTTPKDKGLSQVASKYQEAFDKITNRDVVKLAPQLQQLVY